MKTILDNSIHARRPLDIAGQDPRRWRERGVRRQALAFARWTGRLGLPRCQAADRLNLRPGTLGRWDQAWDADRLPARALGRPRRLADPLQRLHIAHHLQQAGPTLGLPALRGAFPDQARSQLADLQHDYRRQWFSNHQLFADTLQWLVPGSVWAGDFSQSPIPIEQDAEHVLAVRDLPSRKQLSLLPAEHADALTAAAALEHLFITFGPPLVFKSDNGRRSPNAVYRVWSLQPLHRRRLPGTSGSLPGDCALVTAVLAAV